MKTIAAAGRSFLGAVGDMFSGALFGQVLWGVVLAVGLVAGATWAVLTYAIPLIPTGDLYGLGWLWSALRFVGSLGVFFVALALTPPITMFVGGLLFSNAKQRIETQRLGVASTGSSSPIASAGAAVKVSMPSFITNLAFLPAWAIPVLNIVGFVVINAFVSGRAYFDLAAGPQAQALKRANPIAIFLAGLPIAILMLIPALQFLAPTFGAAVMTRLRHRLDPNPAPTAVAGTPPPSPAPPAPPSA
jgi:CysZ protein